MFLYSQQLVVILGDNMKTPVALHSHSLHTARRQPLYFICGNVFKNVFLKRNLSFNENGYYFYVTNRKMRHAKFHGVNLLASSTQIK